MIKISSIFDLQDARYCAAVGVNFVGFSIKTTDENKLLPQKIREITAWLSGTKTILEYDTESAAVLEEMHSTLPYYAVELSEDDWTKVSFLPDLPVFLILHSRVSLSHAQTVIDSLLEHHLDSKIIITVENIQAAATFLPVSKHCFLHFTALNEAIEARKNTDFTEFAGIYVGKEGFLLNKEGLDYENIDRLFG